MEWMIVCFLGIIIYTCCVISSQCSRYEDEKHIEEIINEIEKE